MLPFEFVIDGPPMSAQSRNRSKLAEWKARVRAAAEAHWTGVPFRQNVRVVVTYYHEHRFALLDTDNMVKPILDALIGLVYFDDRQASHIQVRSINLDAGVRGLAVGRELLERLEGISEFLIIRVDEER
jgi:crossover junction endodeoxyribonuclease RusA